MQPPPIPENEAERLASLRRLNILDTPAEEQYDRITRLARRLLGTPIALVSLVDGDRQWFKSAQGVEASETPRELSFCGHAILGDGLFEIPDVRKDERFADNPLVIGDPRIRFYAGQPLHAPDGEKIGTVCVIDSEPRSLSDEDRELLEDLTRMAEAALRAGFSSEVEAELRARLEDAEWRASVDGLTRLWNRSAITELVRTELERARRRKLPFAIALVDIDHFKAINDQFGHPVGDVVLRAVSDRLRRAIRPYDSIGRYGGEEFLVLLTDCSPVCAATVAERIRSDVQKTPIEQPDGAPLDVKVSVGVGSWIDVQNLTLQQMVQAVDDALYRAKEGGRDRVESVHSG